MKKLVLITLMLIGFAAFDLQAQNSKVETVRMILEDPDPDAVKDIRECKKLIDAAAEHSKTSNSPKMWVYRGAVYFEIARKDDELSKENPDAIKIAAESLFKCKETDKDGDWKEQCDFYMLNVANVMFNAAVVQYQKNNYDKALEYYNVILKILPYDTKGDLKTINITENLLYQYSYYASMAKGDNELTKSYINKLIEVKFNDPKIYSALAKVYLDEKDTSNALVALDKGRKLFPNDADLMNMELDIYLKQGKTDVLIKKLSDAIESDEYNTIYYFARASTYEKMDKPELAEKDYEKAIEIDPKYYDAFFNLGVLYVNKAKPLIEKLQKTFVKAEQQKIEKQIKDVYLKALTYFEKCYEIGLPDENKKEKFELYESMQRLYKNVDNKEKEDEFKKLSDEL
ncbi:MAG: tetratricopeptide repeat protein [Flavobacteriales bacterium]|nr:tetratricopeptide repeat protein [Flavobacteriales bacterium]